MKDYPHDEFFKYLFSLVPVVREFITVFLPVDIVRRLDLDTLSLDDTEYITPELAAVYSDKVYRCRLKSTSDDSLPIEAALAILLEHKSFAPPHPHFQLNEYRQRIWTTQTNNSEKPLMVLPIVLFHGTGKWQKRDMADYFGNLPEEFKPYIGGFDYWLVDLSQFNDGYLLKLRLGFLAYGLLTMKHSQDKTYLADQMKLIFEKGEEFLKTGEGRTFVETLFVYYARIASLDRQTAKEKIMQNMTQSMQSAALSTYDQLILHGKIEGKIEQAAEVAKNLILELPALSDERIAALSGAPLDAVQKIRQELAQKSKSSKGDSAR